MTMKIPKSSVVQSEILRTAWALGLAWVCGVGTKRLKTGIGFIQDLIVWGFDSHLNRWEGWGGGGRACLLRELEWQLTQISP